MDDLNCIALSVVTRMNRVAYDARNDAGRIFCREMAEELAGIIADHRAVLSERQLRALVAIGGLILLHVDREEAAEQLIEDTLFLNMVRRDLGGGHG